MKVLKSLGTIVLCVLSLGLLVTVAAPASFQVERSAVIQAPPAEVFEQIAFYRNWQDWSPWFEKDPDMVLSIQGEDGTVGASYFWSGNSGVGSGTISTTDISEDRSLTYHLQFTEPWQSEADGYFHLEPVPDGTKVYWGFSGDSPLHYRWMNYTMEAFVAPDFEQGLAALKAIAEHNSPSSDEQTAAVLQG